MGSGDRVEKTAQQIENALRGDQISKQQLDRVDALLDRSHILDDATLTEQLATRLENGRDRGRQVEPSVLPKLAFDFSDNHSELKTNGALDQGKVEEFARSDRVSPTHKLVAQALLNRWNQIDVDGVPGISKKELDDWAEKHGVQRPAAISDVRVHQGGVNAKGPGGTDIRVGRRSGEVNVGGMGIRIGGDGRITVRRSK